MVNTEIGLIIFFAELIGELEAKQCQPEWELMKVSAAGPGLPLSTMPSRMTGAPNTAISSPQPSGEALGAGVGLVLGDP